MKRSNYADNDISEADVLRQLDGAGLRYRNQTRYILSQCPLHEDKNPSIQIYKDDWFVLCHAGCEGGRFHITKAFPALREQRGSQPNKNLPTSSNRQGASARSEEVERVSQPDKTPEITKMWESLPPIPDSHELHTVPAEVMNYHGWRWDGRNNRYLIPYFKQDKKTIVFAQWRNLSGNIRFNFWKDAKPILYGAWNLEPNQPIFLVEGTSDGMVLDFCAVPWLAIPSASSGELIRKIAPWLKAHNVEVIFAGDNDTAGNKIRDILDEVMYYRVRQPKKPYKDWGEMMEAEGLEAVSDYCLSFVSGGTRVPAEKVELK